MTKDAQSALRRTMEVYTKVTRFILICNYVSKIIEPIASRTSKFRFQQLKMPIVLNKLSEIAENESLTFSREALSIIASNSNGDMRQAITRLQIAANSNAGNITTEAAARISCAVPNVLLTKFKDTVKLVDSKSLVEFCNFVMKSGAPVDDFIALILDSFVTDHTIKDVVKAKLALLLSKAEFHLANGCSAELELTNLLFTSQNILN